MKKITLIMALSMLLPLAAHASLIFQTDFSSLDNWNTVYGFQAADPLDSSNDVLGFSHINGWGDTFSPLFDNTADTYWLTFDYFSTDTSRTNGGGFVGIDPDGQKYHPRKPNGPHTWFLGTPHYRNVTFLPQSDGAWQHVVFSFGVPDAWQQFSLMFEDFRGVPEDALFDNVRLYNTNPVPEPATMVLMGLGLLVLAVAGKKRLT